VVARFVSRCVERSGRRVGRRSAGRVIGGGRGSHFTNADHILFTATRRPGVGHVYLIARLSDRRSDDCQTQQGHGQLPSCDQADCVDPARRTGRGPSAAGARQRGAVQHLAEGHQRVEDLQDAALLQLADGEAAGADPDDGDFQLRRRLRVEDPVRCPPVRRRPVTSRPATPSCRDTRRILSVVRGYSPRDVTAQGCLLEPCPRGTGRQARDGR